jgi:hypothetical protein
MQGPLRRGTGVIPLSEVPAGEGNWRGAWIVATLLFTILPFWVAEFLPITDLPQHVAQGLHLGEVIGGSQRYTATALAPNGLSTVVFWLSTLLFPIAWVPAVVLTLLQLGVIGALFAWSKELGRPPWTAALGSCFSGGTCLF